MLWVNYYSINCLYGVLPTDHLECWRHLVLASRLLCKRNMNMDDIKLADTLLLKFCQRFQVLYGPESVTPNIHLHGHLLECIKDYGPMCNFWLFSFERFNGLLGDEPTNNRSIELQLVNRFIRDNAHLQMLSSFSNSPAESASVLSHSVLKHAFNFTSTRHLDVTQEFETPAAEFVPDTKHTISSFSSEMTYLTNAYRQNFSALFDSHDNIVIPQSYRKMMSITFRGHKIKSGQYVLAHCNVPFAGTSSMKTYFHDPNVRPAKILFFFIHAIQVNATFIDHIFAYVSWPMRHPLHDIIGQPYEVWCCSLNENIGDNYIIPAKNIVSFLLTSQQKYEGENVLVTVPVID